MLVGFLKRSVYKHLHVHYSHFYGVKVNRPFQDLLWTLKKPRSQIFVDTAEKSVLNLFCKLLRFKSDTSETSKDVALQTRKILQMFVIFSFQGITSLGLNFVGL